LYQIPVKNASLFGKKFQVKRIFSDFGTILSISQPDSAAERGESGDKMTEFEA